MNRIIAFAAILLAGVASANEYRDARAELIAAYQAQDFAAMVKAAEKSLQARPEFPGALFNLAYSQVLNGEADNAFNVIEALADMGVDFGVADADEFTPVRALEGWPALERRLRALHDPVGDAAVAATYDDSTFVPEGIAINSEGDLYLGSIRKGLLVNATDSPTVLSDRDGHWSVFGMRFHPDGSLWFASSAVAQLEAVGGDEGKAGLFRFDPVRGEITKAAIMPDYAENQVLGDLIIADTNTLYTTDSVTGGVYRYNIDANEFEILVEPGRLVSPQGLVLDASGQQLYVADYNGGLFRASLRSRALVKVRSPSTISDYGIDGLYRVGNELIVIQNGIRPHRVAALTLDETGLEITDSRVLVANHPDFDEPTLGAVVGDDFYFVANSHWNRFGRDNSLPDDLSGPVILKISLR